MATVGKPLRVTVESRADRPACRGRGTVARVKEQPVVELVDLPSFGRPARLVWREHRWCCPSPSSRSGSRTGLDARIAAPRLAMTDRATLDLSGPWRLAFTTMLPDATQVADPFHLVKLANQRLDTKGKGEARWAARSRRPAGRGPHGLARQGSR